MSDQLIRCEVSEVIFRALNRPAPVKLRWLGVANVARCNCVSEVYSSDIGISVQTFVRNGFVCKSIPNGDLQRPSHFTPSFVANLANQCRNLANWSPNLAISEANLASDSSLSQGIMSLCEVSEVISLPSHVRTRTRTRAG